MLWNNLPLAEGKMEDTAGGAGLRVAAAVSVGWGEEKAADGWKGAGDFCKGKGKEAQDTHR